MMTIKPEQLDVLLGECKPPADVDKLYSQFLQRLISRSLETEMTAHLGYGSGESAGPEKRSNTHNGKIKKTVKGTFGELAIEMRDQRQLFIPVPLPQQEILLSGRNFFHADSYDLFSLSATIFSANLSIRIPSAPAN